MENSSSTAADKAQTMDDNSKHSKINLPDEIVTNILSRLPVKPIFQSQCISKSFSTIANDPHFVDAHLRQSSQLRPSIIVGKWYGVSLVRCSIGRDSEITVENLTLHPDFDWPDSCVKTTEIVGSCNGLVVVVVDKYKEDCYLWNPATIQSDPNIPSNSRVPDLVLESASWGFGYCMESRVYKIVRIASYNSIEDCFIDHTNSKFLVEVFTYEEDWEWRRLDFSKFNVMCNGHGVTINGVVYWQSDDDANNFLTFDLAKEEFALFACPVPIRQIMVFRGSLAVCAQSEFNERSFDLWVLKDENCCVSNESSWEKIFTTTEFVDMEPVRCLNDRHLLLLNQIGDSMENTFDWVYPCYLYDLECKEIKQIPGLLAGHWLEIHNFAESIVALYGSDVDTDYNSSESCDCDHYDEVTDNNEDDTDDFANSEDEVADGGKNEDVIYFDGNGNNRA